jgi:hypothetical protein
MQAPIEVSRRGVGEVFSLDILSHRMSEMTIFHQWTIVSHPIAINDGPESLMTSSTSRPRAIQKC